MEEFWCTLVKILCMLTKTISTGMLVKRTYKELSYFPKINQLGTDCIRLDSELLKPSIPLTNFYTKFANIFNQHSLQFVGPGETFTVKVHQHGVISRKLSFFESNWSSSRNTSHRQRWLDALSPQLHLTPRENVFHSPSFRDFASNCYWMIRENFHRNRKR